MCFHGKKSPKHKIGLFYNFLIFSNELCVIEKRSDKLSADKESVQVRKYSGDTQGMGDGLNIYFQWI